MGQATDAEIIQEAQRIAEEGCRRPERDPGMAAALGAAIGFMIVTMFATIERYLGVTIASLLTIAGSAAVPFLDTRMAHRRNTRLFIEALSRLRNGRELLALTPMIRDENR